MARHRSFEEKIQIIEYYLNHGDRKKTAEVSTPASNSAIRIKSPLPGSPLIIRCVLPFVEFGMSTFGKFL
ncbi:hypothetical protein [Aliicoccus persicus]|uniref:hypothetical protein n=1 Tax=Aliicoccus persicus TaxID=930138 RepID=UPI0011789F54|nr:hypothetical protein [Aliicoccus persicus]